MSDTEEHQFGDLTVRIEREHCISTANCMRLAEDIFEFDEQDLCAFKKMLPDSPERERLLEACRVCPVDALIVIDQKGQQLVP